VSKPKGGRGKKAPYDTTVVRVPNPVLAEVEQIIDAYRNGGFTESKLLVQSFDDIKDQVDQWRKSTKVGKEKLQNLLQLIYGVEIEL
jgi:CHASE3 domain sensor protein